MQDLTGKYPAELVPSSMEGGNLTTPPEQVKLTMTAPGSKPVTPMPPPGMSSQLPVPVPSGPQIPVSGMPGAPVPAPAATGFVHAWSGKSTEPIWEEVP